MTFCGGVKAKAALAIVLPWGKDSLRVKGVQQLGMERSRCESWISGYTGLLGQPTLEGHAGPRSMVQ